MNKKKKIYILISALLVVAIVSGIGIVYAKYVYNRDVTVKLEKTTRFTSNYLTTETPTYTIYGNSVTITMTADCGYIITSTKDGSLSSAADTHTHTLSGASGETVTVTATATDTISKTISAVFEFVGTTAKYQVIDETTFVALHIYTGTTSISGIIVNYGKTLAPDNTNEKMSTWLTANGSAVLNDLEPNSHYQFVFFKIMPTIANADKLSDIPDSKTITLYRTIEGE